MNNLKLAFYPVIYCQCGSLARFNSSGEYEKCRMHEDVKEFREWNTPYIYCGNQQSAVMLTLKEFLEQDKELYSEQIKNLEDDLELEEFEYDSDIFDDCYNFD